MNAARAAWVSMSPLERYVWSRRHGNLVPLVFELNLPGDKIHSALVRAQRKYDVAHAAPAAPVPWPITIANKEKT